VIEPPIRLGAPLLLPSVVSLSQRTCRPIATARCDLGRCFGTNRPPPAGHPAHRERSGEVGLAANALLWSPDAKRLASSPRRRKSAGLGRESRQLQTSFQSAATSRAQHEALRWSGADSKFLAARSGGRRRRCILDGQPASKPGVGRRSWPGSSNAMAWDPASQKLHLPATRRESGMERDDR
jgi:hypothetical protein